MFRNPPGSTDQTLAVETGRFFSPIHDQLLSGPAAHDALGKALKARLDA